MEPIFIPFLEFCRRYGMGRTKAYEILKAGEVQKAKIGSRTFITAESARAFERRAIDAGQS